ncbi:MAG: LacI family DNA-binding transcriptional regulator [Betaproteobacteria bacterium]
MATGGKRAAPKVPATLLEVARRARVAKSTASRAISNPGRVSEKTAARILKAAADLDYVSNGVARALSTRSTRTVGAVVPTLDNAIYAVSTHSLEQRLQKAGYMLLVACHEFDLDAETRALEALLSRGADAIVLVGLTHRKRAFELLARAGVPYVLTWNYRAGRPCVGFDNHEAGVLVADHLLALGHRRIGMIAGIVKDNDRAAARVRGVRDRLAKAGLSLAHLVEREYSLAGGREGLSTLLASRPPPSAIVCGNDILALGALDEARRRGIGVPRELSITGFDDMALAPVATPPLTTVHFPMAEVGANAAAYILRALDNSDGPVQQQLEVRLAVRESSGPSAGGSGA